MRRAQCNCLKDIKQKIEQQLMETEPNYKKRSLDWDNTVKSNDKGEDLPVMNISYSVKSKQPRGAENAFVLPVLTSHCPFCGKPYHVEH